MSHLLQQAQVTSWSGKAGGILRRRARSIAAAIVAVAATAGMILAASGCAEAGAEPAGTAPGAGAVSAPVVPMPLEPVAPGGRVERSPGMPAPVAKALAGNEVMVVAFVLSGPADDRAVARALRTVRSQPAYRNGVRYFVYRVDRGTGFGDLADLLGVDDTPAVAVIGRDRALVNLWSGLIDAPMLRQSINDAAASAAVNITP